MSYSRRYSKADLFCLGLDQAMRTLWGHALTTGRSYPGKEVKESELTVQQRKDVAALMRVNHAGEVCAQALYHGQAWVARDPNIKKQMVAAAIEEGDHLAWCQQRLFELGSHTSYLNLIWYTGSLAIGMAAGWVGDQWGLGFVAETESQVVKHLEHHLELLSAQDKKSYKILQQMQHDEMEHRDEALQAGGVCLPTVLKKWMSFTAKIMVKTAYFF